MTTSEKAQSACQLREIAKQFYDKAIASVKSSDAALFMKLASDANSDAEKLESELKLESSFYYVALFRRFPATYAGTYPDYLEFCLRNGFQSFHRDDFERAMDWQADLQDVA